ncbi:Endoribonuclease L-PSP [Mycolicibacterium vanbaalenii PYR-1]|uniref:Endoribonuclease L-PSP n=1 Tax=Mycolicibacterium vanbaalenii (strain DSM 7251 / JCM 13017 / BCRC 16820 / KCTC 9966 / NRRL B-24157 / PYR-1) TaxID=350058 RepID=A1T4R5_MYCVP|nr:Endoribonuclease L-PSP [Mycolicibacterium vanbaalenii PYR-1]
MSTEWTAPPPRGGDVSPPQGDCAPPPQGDYVPAVRHGDVAHSAGMTPRRDGVLVVSGVVGDTLSVDQARAAAAMAAGNALAAVRSVLPEAAGLRCLRMTVYIVCAPGFRELSAVADGASAALAAALGAAALPARSAIGVLALPSGAPVEVDLSVGLA